MEIENPDQMSKAPWYTPYREHFSPRLKSFNIDATEEYFYSRDGNDSEVHTSSQFTPINSLYQVYAHLLDESLHVFSCFVKGDININAWNYEGHPRFDQGHRNFDTWQGPLHVFLDSMDILREAISSVHLKGSRPLPQGDVKLIHPELGAVVMRPKARTYTPFLAAPSGAYLARDPEDPATLVLSKHALEKLTDSVSKGF